MVIINILEQSAVKMTPRTSENCMKNIINKNNYDKELL